MLFSEMKSFLFQKSSHYLSIFKKPKSFQSLILKQVFGNSAFHPMIDHYQWTVMPFGLKVAPSLFQKAMVKIFSPILHHVLVYIDDILLFSTNHQTHQKLLSDFLDIVQEHGIMLSKKKSSIGKESIDFLGMVLHDGHYHLRPHIAEELTKFSDTYLNKKQIQQFLGIVNYLRDFISKVAVHTSKLSRMLKKRPPPWGPEQTTAVKQLKKISQSPPPLKIPTTGQRVLQTDASDEYQSATLLEKNWRNIILLRSCKWTIQGYREEYTRRFQQSNMESRNLNSI